MFSLYTSRTHLSRVQYCGKFLIKRNNFRNNYIHRNYFNNMILNFFSKIINIVPNFFSKAEIPAKIPKDMRLVINKLKKSKNKKDCLKQAYNVLYKKYNGCHIYVRFFDIFIKDLDKLWSKNGDSHCHSLCYLLRVLLVKSGFFNDMDIELRRTLVCYFSPHAYLKIRLNKD